MADLPVMPVRTVRWTIVALAVIAGLIWAPAAPAGVKAHFALPKKHHHVSAKARAHEPVRIVVHGHAVRRRPVRRPKRPAPLPPTAAPAPPPASVPVPSDCSGADTVPTASTTGVAAAAVACLINQERAAAGLAALATNSQLAAAATGHSQDMVVQQYFSHDSLDGRSFMDRLRAAGWSPTGSWTAGENIAWGSGSYGTPRSIVRSWMNSPGHRANILNARYRESGVGVAAGAPQRTSSSAATYTQDFAGRS
jgi:uncharacterized protein YkwD